MTPAEDKNMKGVVYCRCLWKVQSPLNRNRAREKQTRSCLLVAYFTIRKLMWHHFGSVLAVLAMSLRATNLLRSSHTLGNSTTSAPTWKYRALKNSESRQQIVSRKSSVLINVTNKLFGWLNNWKPPRVGLVFHQTEAVLLSQISSSSTYSASFLSQFKPETNWNEDLIPTSEWLNFTTLHH